MIEGLEIKAVWDKLESKDKFSSDINFLFEGTKKTNLTKTALEPRHIQEAYRLLRENEML